MKRSVGLSPAFARLPSGVRHCSTDASTGIGHSGRMDLLAWLAVCPVFVEGTGRNRPVADLRLRSMLTSRRRGKVSNALCSQSDAINWKAWLRARCSRGYNAYCGVKKAAIAVICPMMKLQQSRI